MFQLTIGHDLGIDKPYLIPMWKVLYKGEKKSYLAVSVEDEEHDRLMKETCSSINFQDINGLSS